MTNHLKPEDLFGFSSDPLVLDIVLYLCDGKRATFRALQQEFYEVDNPEDLVALYDADMFFGEILDDLSEWGYLQDFPVGDSDRYAECAYALTPEGVAIAQTIEIRQDEDKTVISVIGSDGVTRSRLNFDDED